MLLQYHRVLHINYVELGNVNMLLLIDHKCNIENLSHGMSTPRHKMIACCILNSK